MKDIFNILNLIEHTEIRTQRELAKKAHLSLGKTNRIIKKAIKKGYLEDTKTYTITSSGYDLLKKHQVDNAIIMAAGFGSRFVPMTYDTPKGLLEVHGEVMIERQIKQLHEVGIDDITIVVGYLKEKFEYLTDKYGVKLIYNPDYAHKNNISSIYYAQKEMKNTYLLTSDIYMTENVYRRYESHSFYAIEYFENETDEWAVKLSSDDLIIDASPKGGQNTWAMYGPVFLTEDFSQNLVSLINEVYDRKFSDQWYWEDVYIRNIDKLKLYGRKFEKDTILEFESLEELREFDESYLTHSRSEVLDVICSVFVVELAEITNIEILKEGMTNDSFLFNINKKKYVFRNPGVGTELLINRKEESDVYDKIKPLGISDHVIYIDPNTGYKITEFIKNSRVLNTDNKEEVAAAMMMLKELHQSGITVEHEFSIEERIEYYLQLCHQSKAILFSDFDAVYENINLVIEKLQEIPREKCLCHIDPAYTNFLFSDEGITLIDWEYSGMADPLIDLAMHSVYSGLQDEEIIELLDIYLEREHTEEELFILYAYIALAGFLWSLWTLYKQSSGENFGTYAIEQYQYARKYSRLVLNKIK